MSRQLGLAFILSLAGVVFAPTFVYGQEGVNTGIHHIYESPRAMGMGGAFVAVANDYNALFYNPAGLARVDESQFNGALEFGLSGQQFLDFAKDLDTASKVQGTSESFNAFYDVLQKNYGKQFSFRASLFQGIFSHPNWAIGILPAQMALDMSVHNQGTPALNVRSYLDTVVAFGYGQAFRHEMIPGKFSWGITSKFVHRGYANRQVNSLDLMTDSNFFKSSDLRDGYTIDFDWGLLFTPALPSEGLSSVLRYARPTFGLVVRNVLDTGFNQTFNAFNKDDTDPPERLYRRLDLGSRWELPAFAIFNWRMVADAQDLMHPNYSLRKALHLGAEFDWTMAGWWKGQYRMGVNQGYPTVGASFLLTVFRLDLTTFGEDIGSTQTPRENRVYKLTLNLDI